MTDEEAKVIKNELDCWQEENPICPYCGAIEDSADIQWLGGDEALPVDCEDCGAIYYLLVETKKTYTTSPHEGWGNIRIDKSGEPGSEIH